MKRLLASAAAAVALVSAPAHAATYSVTDPATKCVWSVSGPTVMVYSYPAPVYVISGGAHVTRTCADPSSSCSVDVEHSTFWVSPVGGTGGLDEVSVQPGYCWL